MRVEIIRAGAVGSAFALALVMRGAAREVVLVDRTRQRSRAVATDLQYGTPPSPTSASDASGPFGRDVGTRRHGGGGHHYDP
jgi:malate/lactate dehydrogenase